MKSNLVPHASAQGYRVTSGTCAAVIEWLGPAAVTVEEAALGAKLEPGGVLYATQWLVRVLSSGEVLASGILRQAKEAGISERTLERPKAKLNVMSRQIRVGKEARWVTGRFGRILKVSDLPKIDEDEEW